MNNIQKIWGERNRVLLNNQTEIDLLYLKGKTFCSTHTHKEKANKFILISGQVTIETEFGKKELDLGIPFTVLAPMKHRFVVFEDSTMLEIAFVDKGKIDPNDINRESLGGRIIDKEFLTIDDLKEKGLLEL